MGKVLHLLLLVGLTCQIHGKDVTYNKIEDVMERYIPQLDFIALRKFLTEHLTSVEEFSLHQILVNYERNISESCTSAVGNLIKPAIKYIKERDIPHLISWLKNSTFLLCKYFYFLFSYGNVN